MNPPDLDWRQQWKLREQFDALSSPAYTMLMTFADQLAARDAEAICAEAEKMLENGYFYDTKQLRLLGPLSTTLWADSALDLNLKEIPLAETCYLRLFRWCAPSRTYHPGLITHTEQKAVILYLKNRPPWLVDWTGDCGPPPPAWVFPAVHAPY